MILAALAWISAFGLSGLFAAGAARQTALIITIPFPSYDDIAIYNQIKRRVFGRMWLICAIVGSTFVAVAMLADEVTMLLLIASGVILIVVQTSVQGYQLFHVALSEMSLPWPPPTGN